MTAEAAFRVTYGWSAFADFTDNDEALAFAADMASRPCDDPLCAHVSILNLQQPAPYPVVMFWTRDAA